jgi:hypothetical protein
MVLSTRKTPAEVRWISKNVTGDLIPVRFPVQLKSYEEEDCQLAMQTRVNASKRLSNGHAQLTTASKQICSLKSRTAHHFVTLVCVIVSCMDLGAHRSHSVGSLLGSLCYFQQSSESKPVWLWSDHGYNRRVGTSCVDPGNYRCLKASSILRKAVPNLNLRRFFAIYIP